MKIDDFIKKLQDFKKENGNLEIGICRANLSESDYEKLFKKIDDDLKIMKEVLNKE